MIQTTNWRRFKKICENSHVTMTLWLQVWCTFRGHGGTKCSVCHVATNIEGNVNHCKWLSTHVRCQAVTMLFVEWHDVGQRIAHCWAGDRLSSVCELKTFGVLIFVGTSHGLTHACCFWCSDFYININLWMNFHFISNPISLSFKCSLQCMQLWFLL